MMWFIALPTIWITNLLLINQVLIARIRTPLEAKKNGEYQFFQNTDFHSRYSPKFAKWISTLHWYLIFHFKGPNKTRISKTVCAATMCLVSWYGNIILILTLVTKSGITPNCHLLPSVILAITVAFIIQVLIRCYRDGVFGNWNPKRNDLHLCITEINHI